MTKNSSISIHHFFRSRSLEMTQLEISEEVRTVGNSGGICDCWVLLWDASWGSPPAASLEHGRNVMFQVSINLLLTTPATQILADIHSFIIHHFPPWPAWLLTPENTHLIEEVVSGSILVCKYHPPPTTTLIIRLLKKIFWLLISKATFSEPAYNFIFYIASFSLTSHHCYTAKVSRNQWEVLKVSTVDNFTITFNWNRMLKNSHLKLIFLRKLTQLSPCSSSKFWVLCW